MIVLTQVQDHVSNIRGLLPKKYPNIAMVEGILEGKILGKIWCCSRLNAYLLTTNSSFNFIIGRVDHRFLNDAISRIHLNESPFIVFCTNSEYLLENSLPIIFRKHFSCDPKEITELSPKLFARISAQYQIKSVDPVLFEDCTWNIRLLEFYGSKERFLQNGYGIVLLKNQQIVSELYGVIGGAFFELGAVSSPKSRGFGLVPYGMAHSIKHYCASKGLMITASCEVDNTASEKTIKILGFKEDFEYPVLDISNL